jgi:uncharacterized integral membrane protein (TIGR00698 family)
MSTTATYAGPEWARWLDSMEGVPERPAKPSRPTPRGWRIGLVKRFERVGEFVPGIALALGLAVAGERIAFWIGTRILGFEHSPISAVPVAVLLGLLIRNTIGVPAVYEPGLKISIRFLLRLGIVLLGLRLSLATVSLVGLAALPLIVICIASAMLTAWQLGRWLGLSRRLSALIAVGTSICGVSAIVATAAAIDAEDDEVSYAVACVTLFGLLALFGYPFFAYWACAEQPQLAGVFLGTAIHDTAQVTGAALIYQDQFNAPEALNYATVTKLLRNSCMAAVIPFMALLYHRSRTGHKGAFRWYQAVPLFVVLFVVAATLRTVGDLGDRAFGFLSTDDWHDALRSANWLSGWCLMLAMVSVGLGTGLAKLRHIGLKPFVVGLATALVVGAISLCLLTLVRLLNLTTANS